MILSDKTIKSLIKNKRLVIEPLDEKVIQPSSIDLKISDEILFIEEEEVVFGEAREVKYREMKCKEIVIPPKKFILVRTVERVELPNDIAGMVKLRSSLSRIGLFLNNAGWIDPGFKGTITLSVFNANDVPLKIKIGSRFVQLTLMKVDKETRGYKGKYINQFKVTGNF